MYEKQSSFTWWKKLLVGLVVAGGVVGIIAADDTWAWRDTLRRMAHGEEVPAYRAKEWLAAHVVREELADNLMRMGSVSAIEKRETRRDLALHALLVAAGDDVISRGGDAMGALMEELGLDVDWLEGIVYSCPLEHAQHALPILAHVYGAEKRRMAGLPANRRLAAALAFEFARAGLDEKQARDAFLFYAASGQKHWLNHHFSELSLWEMRVIASHFTQTEWSGEETLTWFQRNTRLPAQGYVTLGDSLGSHETSLFGEPVDTQAFKALYQDSAAGGLASMYEASGCSTPLVRAWYAATAACANGVPALVVSAEREAACLVHVNGRWVASAPVSGDMRTSWAVFGHPRPDFVQLAAVLGANKEQTLTSARLAQMGQFHYDAGNRPLAHSFFQAAVTQQPQNYAAWVSYLACGAPKEEVQEAAGKHFDELPGVAAALNSLAAQAP